MPSDIITHPLLKKHAATHGTVSLVAGYRAPPGLSYVDEPRVQPLCRQLGIEFAPAHVGWSRQERARRLGLTPPRFSRLANNWPVIRGVVVPIEDADRLLAAIAARKEKKAAAKAKKADLAKAKAHAKRPTAWEQLGDDFFVED